MARHYYQIDLTTSVPLEEEEIQEIEDLLRAKYAVRVFTEYVDSEG